ncbi:MAG: hypothetical protein KDA99_10890, partial [Planctomycetales bacterium]|nr:hypothetical protein [Planctomycetales bacterium]
MKTPNLATAAFVFAFSIWNSPMALAATDSQVERLPSSEAGGASSLLPPPVQSPGGVSDEAEGDADDLLIPAPPLPSANRRPPGTSLKDSGLFPPPPVVSPHGKSPPAKSDGGEKEAKLDGPDPHLEVFSKSMYPSAKECRTCHEKIYDEWAVSNHAYAAISPMFHRFEQTINDLAQGTIGYFCMRCHSPVGTSIGHPRNEPIINSIPAAYEGVTCVVCHRVKEAYGKVNGERRMEPGSLFDPVFGAGYGEGLAEVLAKKDHYKVKTSPEDKKPGQNIHTRVIHFEQISTSHFCVSCHQVAVLPGIKLEVVWEQYRASPACKAGIRCQDCHMGKVPGQPLGFETAPVAIVNDKPVSPDRRHSNHLFYGPGYSIAHPGVFPFNPKAEKWSKQQWLQFDWRAGWGTDEFEEPLEGKKTAATFPKVWAEADDRYDAREIIAANLKTLAMKKETRRELMERGSHIEGPFFTSQPVSGRALEFHYAVTNLNSGHNMPSGSLGAQPQVWLNVVLTGPRGNHLWESGYVDRNGDMADLHSLEVAARRIPADQQLFNLQTKFLITHVKGTDREMYLPINVDIDQLPFIRPSAFPISTLNHPPFIRMEAHSLPPLGTRNAKYRVPADRVCEPGPYRL